MRAFLLGFLDELRKAAGFREDFDRMTSEISKRHAAHQELHWMGVKDRLAEAVKRRLGVRDPARALKPPPLARGYHKTATSFSDIVHHPLVQALGYGALAGEGAHLLAEMSKRPRLRAMAKSKWGRRFGKGSIGVGAAFLGAEGLSALTDLFKRKKKEPEAPKAETPEHKRLAINIQLQPPNVQPKFPRRLPPLRSLMGMRR